MNKFGEHANDKLLIKSGKLQSLVMLARAAIHYHIFP